jgi:hypothetical protein
MTKTDAKICRSFRQDFPEFVARAEALDVRISLSEGRRNGRERVFWLDGYRQMTGYTTRSDGRPFTREDAARNIDKILAEIEGERVVWLTRSPAERFARVMSEFRKIEPQYRMIGEVRMPSGDRAHCFFMAKYDGAVSLHGIGEVAKAKAEWRRDELPSNQLARFCDALEADFAKRAALTAEKTNG